MLMKKKTIKEIAKENNGYIETKEALKEGYSKSLFLEEIKSEDFKKVAKGIYLIKGELEDEAFILQKRYPKAIFSHSTALYLLGLSSRDPLKYSITLKTGTSSSNLVSDRIVIYKVKEELFELGLINVNTFLGNNVRSYNVERTLCDLLRSRKKLDIQDFQQGLKTYLKQNVKNIPLLLDYAKKFRVDKLLLTYLDVLL